MDSRLHDRISHDHRMRLARRCFQYRGDQVGIRRQRQKFALTVADRLRRGVGIVAGAARHHRHGHALGGERTHHRAYIVHDVAQHQIDPRIGTQARQGSVRVIGLVQLRAMRHGDPPGLANLASKRSDDQDPHQFDLSALTISVIVTPRRLSSTITTSPRATRRLLT